MTVQRMTEFRTTLIGALLVALGPVSMALYTPAMPELVHAFGSTESMIKLTLSLYFGGFAVAQLVAGTLSDAWGRRRVTLIFMAIYLAGSLMSALAPSVEVLLAGRLIQGVGASAGMTVARAIVRDQFTGDRAAGIMNLIGMMLAIGPAISPTLGGLALGLWGWQSIFLMMVVFGAAACLISFASLKETVAPDPSMLRMGPIFSAYREVLSDPRFLSGTLVIGGAVGALYTQATVLPFILIGAVGLTPAQFGLGMLMQSGMFLLGTIVMRQGLKRFHARQMVVPGLVLIGVASVLLALSVHYIAPSYLSIMLPVGLYAFGIAFINPYMMTAAIAPFPHIAGTASALMGFVQMGSGVVGGIICAAIGKPLLAFGTVIPAFGVVCLLAYAVYMVAVRAKAGQVEIAAEGVDSALERQAAE
jgi:DHA1 family bicyclomycin/chloramphenicol resistance-like MFS transporter